MAETGAFLGVGRAMDRAVQRAKLAEALGYGSIWMTQTAGRDSIMALLAYGQATERVRLGTGVVPIYQRTPAAMAQAAATANELTGGRFVLGIGVSHKPAVEAMFGQPYRTPLGDMREYLSILCAILREGRASFSGDRFSANFGFMGYEPPHPSPVYISSLSPKMCRLAGEFADGVILWCCTPDYVRDHVAPNVAEGAREAGRDPSDVEIVAAVPLSASDDPDGGRAAMKRDLLVYWTLPNYRRAIRRAGYGDGLDAFDAALKDGGPKEAASAIPDAFCDALGAAGDPKTLHAKVEEYRAKGTTVPAVGPFSGHDGARGAEATLEFAIKG